MDIHSIYKTLFSKYGPQNWWPTKTDQKQFEVIAGAILTQNTSWKNVESALNNLIAKDLLHPDKIKRCTNFKLAMCIRPAGYFNQKAERLKLAAEFFLNNDSPTRKDLLELKGVGPETADSISLYAYGLPEFVVDAYTKRIFTRLGLLKGEETYATIKDLFEDNLPKDASLYNEFHALIVAHAKEVCRKDPKCDHCMLKIGCVHANRKI